MAVAVEAARPGPGGADDGPGEEDGEERRRREAGGGSPSAEPPRDGERHRREAVEERRRERHQVPGEERHAEQRVGERRGAGVEHEESPGAAAPAPDGDEAGSAERQEPPPPSSEVARRQARGALPEEARRLQAAAGRGEGVGALGRRGLRQRRPEPGPGGEQAGGDDGARGDGVAAREAPLLPPDEETEERGAGKGVGAAPGGGAGEQAGQRRPAVGGERGAGEERQHQRGRRAVVGPDVGRSEEQGAAECGRRARPCVEEEQHRERHQRSGVDHAAEPRQIGARRRVDRRQQQAEPRLGEAEDTLARIEYQPFAARHVPRVAVGDVEVVLRAAVEVEDEERGEDAPEEEQRAGGGLLHCSHSRRRSSFRQESAAAPRRRR